MKMNCLAQGHIIAPLVRFEPVTIQSKVQHTTNFFFFFFSSFTSLSRLFHSYRRDEPISRWGDNGSTPKKQQQQHFTLPQAELGFSTELTEPLSGTLFYHKTMIDIIRIVCQRLYNICTTPKHYYYFIR